MGGTLLGVHIVALVRIVLEHIVLVHKVLVHIGVLTCFCTFSSMSTWCTWCTFFFCHKPWRDVLTDPRLP